MRAGASARIDGRYHPFKGRIKSAWERRPGQAHASQSRREPGIQPRSAGEPGDFDLPAGTFFDVAAVHLLTTATIGRLRTLYPPGRFEVRRFRPNIVVSTGSDEERFVEDDWIGHTVAVGNQVRLRITGPCGRCVMTTLPQGDLPKASGILRTAAQHNHVNVGVYADVVVGGPIRRGDPVTLA